MKIRRVGDYGYGCGQCGDYYTGDGEGCGFMFSSASAGGRVCGDGIGCDFAESGGTGSGFGFDDGGRPLPTRGEWILDAFAIEKEEGRRES